MSQPTKPAVECPDCAGEPPVSRRDFVRSVGTAAVAGGLLGRLASPARGLVLPDDKAMKRPAETAATRLYESLTDDQKKSVCFPFDHALRKRINANWQITQQTIEDFFNADQQKLIEEVFRGVTSPDGYERFQKQMEEDYGGLGSYHVALFGKPGSGQFEFEMTGRHLTIRADGDSLESTAFGGPIIYGHGAGDGQKGLPGNVFYYQTRKANEVFQALDGKQRDKALMPKAPNEAEVPIQGNAGKFPGIAAAELSSDQKDLLESVIKVILAPYREADVAEALDILKQGGGLDKLHLAFYKDQDLGDDHEWDIWRLEGPTWVWHFRGAPHVHAYVNIGKKA
ncbi:MAG: DUF3500 domain-containing protein [Isosphaeraceae bacterium]